VSAHAEEFQQVSETLFHWSFYSPSHKCELGSVAIKSNGGTVVVDPAPLAEQAWQELLANAPLRAILLTNGNHVREALLLKKLHHVPIVTAPDTRRDITELKPDVVLLPNELLYGIAPIPIPGATPGETAFYHNSGILMLGDAVINTNLERGLELLPDKYCTDPKQNRASLKTLLAYNFHTLTFAHGAPVTTQAKDKLTALLNS
jgi:glyoxylase-like metal-dependent hydrolase (beta-lactamase superfamily II)